MTTLSNLTVKELRPGDMIYYVMSPQPDQRIIISIVKRFDAGPQNVDEWFLVVSLMTKGGLRIRLECGSWSVLGKIYRPTTSVGTNPIEV